jgi:hypothetical protein
MLERRASIRRPALVNDSCASSDAPKRGPLLAEHARQLLPDLVKERGGAIEPQPSISAGHAAGFFTFRCAAITSAATGRRIRSLPITLDRLL